MAALWDPARRSSAGMDGTVVPDPRNAAEREFRIPADYIIIAIGQRIESDEF